MTQLLSRIRARLSYANLTATLALFIALGGTTYAATSLPRNSVGAAQIRASAVGASEIRADAIRSSEIRARSINLSDIAPAARSSLRGSRGLPGPDRPRRALRAGWHRRSRGNQLGWRQGARNGPRQREPSRRLQ